MPNMVWNVTSKVEPSLSDMIIRPQFVYELNVDI